MPLDSNGIHQYTEFEDAAPFSTLLNRLAGSVSTAVKQLVYHEGPTSLTASSGYTSAVTVERQGRVVNFSGTLSKSSNWTAGNDVAFATGTVPEWARPSATGNWVCAASSNGGDQFRITLHANGQVTVRSSASIAADVQFYIMFMAPEIP